MTFFLHFFDLSMTTPFAAGALLGSTDKPFAPAKHTVWKEIFMKRILPVLLFLILSAASSLLAAPLVSCDLALDRSVLPAGQKEKAVIKVALDVPA